MSMYVRTIIHILLVTTLLLNKHEVEAEQKSCGIEDIDIEKQVKPLNTPVKTIKGEYGEIYDCVDFYKQPAFDHPELKDHNYHPEMSHTLSDLKKDGISSNIKKAPKIGLKDEGCPDGTVPIRRTTKEDLERQSDLSHPISPNGDVHPALYGDTKTRRYIYYKAGNKGCYNVQCPGFVQVDKRYFLDSVLIPTTIEGGPSEEIALLSWEKGNWWLILGYHGRVGFWPDKIFTSLKNGATMAEYGGVVYSPPGLPLPPMGLGHFPHGERYSNSYFKECIFKTNNGEDAPINTTRLATVLSNWDLYRVENFDSSAFVPSDTVMYGGPGQQK